MRGSPAGFPLVQRLHFRSPDPQDGKLEHADMGSVLESIPRSERLEAERRLKRRADQRARQLSHDESAICRTPKTTPERTARNLAARHLQHHEATFQDKLETWTPLVKKYAPESIDRLRDELLAEIPLDSTIAPNQMQRFLKDRLQTFARYLSEEPNPPRARGVRTVRRHKRGSDDKKQRRSETKSKW
jgi:hypothetical protein